MSEKLCLQWNDFKENAVNTFKSLKDDKDFTDVTLVCEDGKEVEVHKVILVNSSPLFQNILRMKKQIHNPLIYMRGMKSEDLQAIVDFLYCGEANVDQESLDSFLAIAAELQLKGLMGKSEKDEIIPDDTFKIPAQQKVKKESSFLKPVGPTQSHFVEQMPSNSSGGELAQTTIDFQELDEKCLSMMEKTSGKNGHGQALYQCKVCGKENINSAIKSHIEANHLEGFFIPCKFCGKTFRSRKSLAEHSIRYHKDCKDDIL